MHHNSFSARARRGVAVVAAAALTLGGVAVLARPALAADKVVTHLSVTVVGGATAVTAGAPFRIQVCGLNAGNSVVSSYHDTVTFRSSDLAAVLPGTSKVNGAGCDTFGVTLRTAGSQTVTATDTGNSSITGTLTVTVSGTSVDHFVVAAPATATAGTAFNFTVTAETPSNAVDTGYAGAVHFTSTDSAIGVSLPANTTLTSGTGTFSATLDTAGSQTITATDTANGSINGTSNAIVVSAVAATHLVVTAPGAATTGTAFNFTVTAEDQFGNTDTAYAGTVQFSLASADAGASLPAASQLTSGSGTFSATLTAVGNQSIIATDTVTASINGTSGTIVVSAPSTATHFVVTAPAGATAGTSFNFTVTAEDASDHTVTNYGGTVDFSSSDAAATLPAGSTLTSGVGTFAATLTTAGNQTITSTDSVTASITGTSNAILVSGLAATHLVVSAPANATSGQQFNLTVTAEDQFGNTDPSYAGTVHFTSSDTAAGVSLPGDTTLTNGTQSFSATLVTLGNQTITATDTATASITGTSTIILVAAAGGGGGGGAGGGGGGAGGSAGGNSSAPPALVRLGGIDRIATAVLASQDSYPTAGSAGGVVLVRSDLFPDALVSTPLASSQHAPILLTPSTTLDPRTQAEIQRVLPARGTIWVVGGTDAVSSSVATLLQSKGFTVQRLSGVDRFATAVAVANALGNPAQVLLADGVGFPDALSAGAAAAHIGGAVVLTSAGTMPAATLAYLQAHPGDTLTAIGGPAHTADPAIPSEVGSDRYATSTMTAGAFFTNPTVVGLATGLQFPDALSGGADIASQGGPILLTDPTTLSAPVAAYLTGDAANLKTIIVYGGTAALTDAVAGAAQAAG